MHKILTRLVAAMLLAVPAACIDEGPDYTWLRTVHAVPDAPALRATFENYIFRETMSFGNATTEKIQSILKKTGPTSLMELRYVGWNNAIADALLTLDVPVEKDAISTVVLAGHFDDIRTITVVSTRRKRPLDRFYFQFAHAEPAMGPLDIYVTAPEVELSATAPLATVSPLGHSGSFEILLGTQRIRLTQAGTLDVVMDSGPLDFPESTDNLGPGGEWLFVITPNTNAGSSPVFLIASSGRSSQNVFDVDTPATVRGLHGAVALGAVTLEALTEPAQVLVPNLLFRERSALVPIPLGDTVIGFRAVEAPEEPLALVPFRTVQGAEYIAALIDSETGAEILVDVSFSRSVVTEARLRLANLTPTGGLISIFLSASEDEPLQPEDRILLNSFPGTLSAQFAVAPGDYFLTLTTTPVEIPGTGADLGEVLIGPVPLELTGGDVLTLALFPPQAEGEPEELRIFDDRLP